MTVYKPQPVAQFEDRSLRPATPFRNLELCWTSISRPLSNIWAPSLKQSNN